MSLVNLRKQCGFLFSGLLLSTSLFAQENFSQCVENLKQRALQEQISAQVIERDLASAQYVARVIELDRKQPEFSQTFHDYFGQRVVQQRIQQGRKLIRQHRALLTSLTETYGVPAQYLVAFWGMETNFGSYLGKMNVVDSLTTLACDPRRSEFFTLELFNALRLIEAGVGTRETMQGSWAGAMGNMQFMPSAYRQYAVDGDNDGRADLWNSLPDALTSAANYLQQLGWQKNWRWGREVILPESFDYSLAGRDRPQTLIFWRQQGVRDRYNRPIPKLEAKGALILPSGHKGPAFLAYENFDVIMKWNRSEFYALSVGILADQINGAGKLRISPPQQEPMAIEEVKALQLSLLNLGFDVGKVDGILGSMTKRALREFQHQNGLIADGDANQVTRQTIREKLAAQTSQSGTQDKNVQSETP